MGQELNGSLGSWVTLSDPFPALVCPVKVMLVVFYAVIPEKQKGVPYMGCFSCAFAFGSYFVFGLRTKNLKIFKT